MRACHGVERCSGGNSRSVARMREQRACRAGVELCSDELAARTTGASPLGPEQWPAGNGRRRTRKRCGPHGVLRVVCRRVGAGVWSTKPRPSGSRGRPLSLQPGDGRVVHPVRLRHLTAALAGLEALAGLLLLMLVKLGLAAEPCATLDGRSPALVGTTHDTFALLLGEA